MLIAMQNDLGLDIRTAAYMNALRKIVSHYQDAGLVFT